MIIIGFGYYNFACWNHSGGLLPAHTGNETQRTVLSLVCVGQACYTNKDFLSFFSATNSFIFAVMYVLTLGFSDIPGP